MTVPVFYQPSEDKAEVIAPDYPGEPYRLIWVTPYDPSFAPF